MTVNTRPQTQTKPKLVIKKITKLTQSMVHHIGQNPTP